MILQEPLTVLREASYGAVAAERSSRGRWEVWAGRAHPGGGGGCPARPWEGSAALCPLQTLIFPGRKGCPTPPSRQLFSEDGSFQEAMAPSKTAEANQSLLCPGPLQPEGLTLVLILNGRNPGNRDPR